MTTQTRSGSTSGLLEAVQTAGAPAPGRSLKDAIEGQKDQIARALPAAISPERFTRIVLSQVSANPQLAECDRASFLGAVMTAAQMGLEFGPLGHAYLVPYKRKIQLIIGYKGYIDLARRSGQIKDIVARPVYEGDEFDYWFDETGDHMIHRPAQAKADRGAIRCYYSRMVFTNGGVHLHVMAPEDVLERKARSASADSNSSPWKSDPLPMALKTVIRAMVPWMPLTPELADQLTSDEAVISYQAGKVTNVEHLDAIDVTADELTGQMTEPNKPIERIRAEQQLEDLILTAPSPAEAKANLMAAWGPIPTLSDEVLSEAITHFTGISSPEVVDDGDPGPIEPPEAAEAASEPPEGPDDDDLIERTTVATVTAWNASKVREHFRLFAPEGTPTPDSLGQIRMDLIGILVELRRAGNAAANDLF